ncbi:MAG: NRDE family protein [Desulfobacter sp.]|nr:MAG: NRDE family protein [Desulfobacter sp.]
MCLILFSIDPSDDYSLILAANRDEFYARPTRPMSFWPGTPRILAGKDLEAGGTWFGAGPSGRFAALTNYRDLGRIKTNAPSRGGLIPEFLAFQGAVTDFLSALDKKAGAYSGFNLLAGEAGRQVYWYSNITRKTVTVTQGIHGLSNSLLDSPWPKVTLGKTALESAIKKDPRDNELLFSLLADTNRPPDHRLPDTGVGLEWERILSPLFIESDTYGTRSSTLMRIAAAGKIEILERTWADAGSNQDRTFALEYTADKTPEANQ